MNENGLHEIKQMQIDGSTMAENEGQGKRCAKRETIIFFTLMVKINFSMRRATTKSNYKAWPKNDSTSTQVECRNKEF